VEAVEVLEVLEDKQVPTQLLVLKLAVRVD
jgi:hypothetical protein